MGMLMSLMGRGLPTTQMLNLVTATLHKRLIGKDIKTLHDFQIAVLDIFNTLNSAFPGKHFDAPSREDIEECFKTWKDEEEPKKREVFLNFMKKKINMSKLDHTGMVAGVIAPPAAMVLKRAGENVPQVRVIKRIPDVVFVPTATILTLISVKISRRLFFSHAQS